ncbi:High affinity cAMP-specific and IBMX-insensitive 3',5'-cyclic phosphodiesterase 8A [Halotydeus destructor]|nr:High affinity cAMP-specific and IBMX-insensitive 3',5'-cyclic phosphodiesterase 8A [Halotydeus destructor]
MARPMSRNRHLSESESQRSGSGSSMAVETPISRVINLLLDTIEKSPPGVAQSLEEALDILRSPDLYAAQMPSSMVSSDFMQRDESDADEITSNLFTGLIHSSKPMSGIRRMSYEAAVANRMSFSSMKEYSAPSTPTPTPSLTNIPTSIKTILESNLHWDMDVIHLEQVTNKRPLVWLGLSIFDHFDVGSTLNCDQNTLRNWLTVIESNYRDNPYHNSTHAADVLQASAFFLSKPRLKAIMDPFDETICLLAAVIHDIDHPGKSSAFLCNSHHELAILYNDVSVLESHHAAYAFKLTMSSESSNIFKNLDKETFKEVRHSVIDMVLATEMTKHFEHLTKFVNVFTKSLSVDEGAQDSSLLDCSNSSATNKSLSRDSPSRLRSSSLTSPENVVLIKRMLIKCADVCNPCRPLHLCSAWAQRIAEEYCNQTDEEKAHGLPVVMPVFDRATCSIPKSQIGFIDYFANDMFEAWDAFGDFPDLIDLLRSNYTYWQGQQRIRDAYKQLGQSTLEEGEEPLAEVSETETAPETDDDKAALDTVGEEDI